MTEPEGHSWAAAEVQREVSTGQPWEGSPQKQSRPGPGKGPQQSCAYRWGVSVAFVPLGQWERELLVLGLGNPLVAKFLPPSLSVLTMQLTQCAGVAGREDTDKVLRQIL